MPTHDARGTPAEALYDLATFVLGTFGYVAAMRGFGGSASDTDWSLAVFNGVCLVYLGTYLRRRRQDATARARTRVEPGPTA